MSFTKIANAQQLDHFFEAYQNSNRQLVVRRDKATKTDVLGFTSKLTFGEKFLRLFGAGGASLKRIANIEFAKQSASFCLKVEKYNSKRRFGKINLNIETLYKTDSRFKNDFTDVFNKALGKDKSNPYLLELNKKKKEWDHDIEKFDGVMEGQSSSADVEREYSARLIKGIKDYTAGNSVPEELLKLIQDAPVGAFFLQDNNGKDAYDYFQTKPELLEALNKRSDVKESLI